MKTLLCIFYLLLSLTAASQAEKILHPPPIPDYTFTGLCPGDTTFFLNKTQMADAYTWQIFIPDPEGDKLIFESQGKDTSFLFPGTGNYRVILWADNGHLVSKERLLTLSNQTKSNFEYVPCEGDFINLSSCVDSSFWDFGDGYLSAESSPKHKYIKTGTYTVSLIVKKGGQSDTSVQSIEVKALGIPLADFTYKADADSVYFFAIDSTADEYSWDFGDNTYKTVPDRSGCKVSHHYNVKDILYEVYLFVQNSCGVSWYWLQVNPLVTSVAEKEKASFISVYPNPASHELNFRIAMEKAQEIEVFLFDISGKLVIQRKLYYVPGIPVESLTIKNLSPGAYALQLKTSADVFSKKIYLLR